MSKESFLFLVLNEALPLTWEKINGNEKRFAVSRDSDEYKSIKSTFDQAMGNQYREMIKIERIQNERWYRQYLAHRQDFQKRLNSDTEKRLYHGCPSTAVESIVEGGFNRSYAGVNGKRTFRFKIFNIFRFHFSSKASPSVLEFIFRHKRRTVTLLPNRTHVVNIRCSSPEFSLENRLKETVR